MSKMKALCILVLSLLSALLVLSVQADDGRINPANYHFGGDVLYCEADNGCHVLNQHGDQLITWSQDSIDAAVQQSLNSNQSVLVSEQQATYGLMGLWVQYVEINDNAEAWHLCLQGYDEWGKSNDMCFKASPDGYQPVGVPPQVTVKATGSVVEQSDPACSLFVVGDAVALIADNGVWGFVTSINVNAGQLTFHNPFNGDTTARCHEVEPRPL